MNRNAVLHPTHARSDDPRLPLLELKPYTCLKYPVSKRYRIRFKLGVEEVADGARFRQITGARGAAMRGLGHRALRISCGLSDHYRNGSKEHRAGNRGFDGIRHSQLHSRAGDTGLSATHGFYDNGGKRGCSDQKPTSSVANEVFVM